MEGTSQVLQQLKALLELLNDHRKPSLRGGWAQQYLRDMAPYAIRGGCVVNREYKPLGVCTTSPYVRHEDWPCYVEKLAAGKDEWLYNDAFAPWNSTLLMKAYKQKLQELIARIEA